MSLKGGTCLWMRRCTVRRRKDVFPHWNLTANTPHGTAINTWAAFTPHCSTLSLIAYRIMFLSSTSPTHNGRDRASCEHCGEEDNLWQLEQAIHSCGVTFQMCNVIILQAKQWFVMWLSWGMRCRVTSDDSKWHFLQQQTWCCQQNHPQTPMIDWAAYFITHTHMHTHTHTCTLSLHNINQNLTSHNL